MELIAREDEPELSDVYPGDLTYAPDPGAGHVRPYLIGGKSIRSILTLGDEYSPKRELHVVADDGDVYIWSRFGDDEPWTFERRLSDGSVDTTKRQLPGSVEAVVIQKGILY